MRRNLAWAVLLASALPGLVAMLGPAARTTAALARMPYAARRARVNGAVWRDSQEIARRFPSDPIPLIMREIRDVDREAFVAYYVYPRVVRTFVGLEEYRALGVDPGARKPVTYVDVRHADGARIMSYAAIRHELIGEEPPVAHGATGAAIGSGIVPFATAFDGAPPDAYMTTLAITADAGANVTLTLEPSHKSATFALRRGESRVIRDAVYECFDEFTSGWIRVEATAPVRVNAWLVNRGRHRVAAVPVVNEITALPKHVDGGDHLYLLNPKDAATSVTVNGNVVAVPARALTSIGAASSYDIDHSGRGAAPLLVFSARKLADGNTQFSWWR